MIDYKDQLKLQSFLDGELSEAEAAEVASWLEREPEPAALLAEMKQTNQALAGFEEAIRIDESREFYWSRVQAEIRRQEAPLPLPRSAPAPWYYQLRRFLVPATGLAVMALLALVATRETGTSSNDSSVETASEDSGAFTYHDYTAGATLVWLSYPADNQVADDEDLNSLD